MTTTTSVPTPEQIAAFMSAQTQQTSISPIQPISTNIVLDGATQTVADSVVMANRLLCPLPNGVTYKHARKKGGVSMELVVRLLGFDISDNDKPLLDGCIKRAIEGERLVITKIWFKSVKGRAATATTDEILPYIVPSINLTGEIECKDGSLKSVNITIGCKAENDVNNDSEFKQYIDRFHAIGTVNSPLSARHAMDNICWLNPLSTNVKASFTISI